MRWQAFHQTILVKSTSSPWFRVIGFNFLSFGKGASNLVQDSIPRHVSDFAWLHFAVISSRSLPPSCSCSSAPLRRAHPGMRRFASSPQWRSIQRLGFRHALAARWPGGSSCHIRSSWTLSRRARVVYWHVFSYYCLLLSLAWYVCRFINLGVFSLCKYKDVQALYIWGFFQIS